jgi:phosphate-selective porin OprO/OprP
MRSSGAVVFWGLLVATAMGDARAQRPPGGGQEGDAATSLHPTLILDTDFRTYPAAEEGNTGFAITRLRPGLRLQHGGWFSAAVVAELAEGDPELLDAFARFQAAAWVSVTAGLSTPPLFSSAIHDASFEMPFPDRAPVVRAFRIRRDLGVGVEITPDAVPLEARFRLSNGTGAPTTNDEGLPALYGNLELASEVLRVGVAGLVERAGEREGIAGRTPVDFVYYQPGAVQGLRMVGVAHGTVWMGPLRLVAEGAWAREGREENPLLPGPGAEAVEAAGMTAAISWVLHGGARREGSIPGPMPGAGFGALELSARYDGMWLGLSALDVSPGGSQGGAVALKWWATDFLSTTLAGTYTRYTGHPVAALGRVDSWSLIARLSVFWGLGGR